MGMAAQILGTLVQVKAQMNAATIAKQQAVVAKKTAKNEQLTEGYNAAQRQRDRIKTYRAQVAQNRAAGGASGIDAFSGSANDANLFSAGNLKTAGYEDIFNSTNKRASITEAGEYKATAFRNKASAASTKAFTTLLNTGSSIYDDTAGFTKWK